MSKKINQEMDMAIEENRKASETIIANNKPLNVIYQWSAPERIFTPKGRLWYVAIAVIAMLAVVYSALTNNLALTFLIICLVLVIYALYSIPPLTTTHKITNRGIFSFGNLYDWRSILFFWVTKRSNQFVINIEFKARPNDLYYERMILLPDKDNLQTIVTILLNELDYLSNHKDALLGKFIDGKYVPLVDIIKLDDIVEAEDHKSKSKKSN